ncbi:hypothetical protein [Niastella sp. OAS944]|uniref:hypothetical protein n=1 Tax=Niastella sp. OAS944 TaxID=2664089 RepID=UPI00348DAA2F|nr:hypothetical protein [Chitinophagaceae bacterium OAS944]
MTIYCLDDFKAEYEKLKKKDSYSSLEKDIIDHFFDKDVTALKAGTRLNNSDDSPYIKKRLSGSGGFRVYYLLIVKNENLYLMFVHPKSGSLGYDNITDESKAALYKKVLACIKTNDLYVVTAVGEKLVFTKKEVLSKK